MSVKYGPTKGEYIFRLCGGLLVFALLLVAYLTKGFPPGLAAVETFLFGGSFAAFLVLHSTYRIAKGLYRIPGTHQPKGKVWRP